MLQDRIFVLHRFSLMFYTASIVFGSGQQHFAYIKQFIENTRRAVTEQVRRILLTNRKHMREFIRLKFYLSQSSRDRGLRITA